MTIQTTRKKRIQTEKMAANKKRNLKIASGVLATGISATALLGTAQSVQACDCVDYYTVKSGDTLYSLAKKYDVSVSQLKSKNGFEHDRIFAGQEIIVPFLDENGEMPIVGEPLEEGEIIHSILPGDTLWSLSRKYDVSVEKLMNDNSLQNATLIAGKTLKINSSSSTSAKSKSEKVSVTTATYVVEPGDTLSSLAKRFDTTVKEIRQLSNLKSDGILIGQKLSIPAGDAITTKATIMGAVDSTSVEILAHHVYWVLEVSYGTAEKYSKMTGKEVTVTFTDGSFYQRPALINMK